MIKLKIIAIGVPKQRQGAKGPFETNYIKTDHPDYAGKFLNFFVGKATQDWKIGQEIEVEDVEKREYTSKKDNSLQTSYDIKLPKFGGNGDVMKALEEIRNRQSSQGIILSQILDAMREIHMAVVIPKPDNYPTPESVGLSEEKLADFSGDDAPPLSDEELESMQ